MEKHKDKALEEQCLCNNCPHKFECFTQERIFSDPIFQGLFEALMAQGMSKEDALEEVSEELKARMGKKEVQDWTTFKDWTYTATTSAPIKHYDNNYKYVCPQTTGDNVTITYHMVNGKDVTWNASTW